MNKSTKVLYYGGQKSGKSRLAEQETLNLAGDNTPYYIATYNNSYRDHEMQARIDKHKSQRKESFITIEEPRDLAKVIEEGETYLVDCVSMLILNRLDDDIELLLAQLGEICTINANIVFVLNDVGSGVIPIDEQSRTYVDRSGIVGQKLAQLCDEVYSVTLGLEHRLK